MCKARWICNRRYRLARSRKILFQHRQVKDSEYELFPSLRGGAAPKKRKSLLEILSTCLAEYEKQEESESDDDALLKALQDLVQKKPPNLLQHLKSIVANFSAKATAIQAPRGAAVRHNSHPRSPPLRTQKNENTWVDVVRRKPQKPKIVPKQGAPVLANQLLGHLRASDWQAPIATNPTELEDLLKKKEERIVLAPAKVNESYEMWAILASSPTVKAALVLPFGFSTEEFAPTADTTTKVDRVPVLVQGSLVMQKVCLYQKGGNTAPSFVPKSISLKGDVQKNATVVLRAATHKALVPDFTMLQQNPGLSARNWINASGICDPLKIGDTWGWNLDRSMVSGVLRVDLAVAPALLRASGQKHGHTRWYFEPLRYADPLPKPFNELPETSWINDKSLTFEQNAACAEKEAVLNDLGVRLGTRSVGVRMIPGQNDANTPKAKHWKATGVPRFLGVDDFEDLLAKAGFENIQINEKFRWRAHTGYAFRALQPENKDVVQIQYGEHAIDVNVQSRMRVQKSTVQLPGEPRIHFARQRKKPPEVVNVDEAEDDDEVAPTVPDTPDPDAYMEGEGSEDVQMMAMKRPPSVSPVKAPAKKPKAANSVPSTFKEIANPGNGDCLFWALSQGLTHAGSKSEKSPLQCRALCVAHLTKHQSTYSRHWDGCYPQKGDTQIPDRDFSVYLQRLAQQSAWGSALEIQAMSMTLDRPIFVYSFENDSMQTYVFNRKGQRKPLFLKFAAAQEHYTCLVPESTFDPSTENYNEGPHVGLRGAAKSIWSNSVGTRKTKCRPDSDSIGTRSSVKKQFQKNQMEDAQSWSSRCPSVSHKPTVRVAKRCRDEDAGHDGMRNDTDNFTWHCKICNRTFRAKRMALLSKKRNGHIRNIHPYVSKSEFHTLRTQHEVVPTSSASELPKKGRWICEYCGEGLPWLPEAQKRLSIDSHLRHCGHAPKRANRSTNAKKRKRSKAGWMGQDYANICEEECHTYGEATGHNLVYLPSDAVRFATVICGTCTRFWNSLSDVKRYVEKIRTNKGIKCPGTDGRKTQLKRKSTLQLWEQFPTWRKKLAQAWCLQPQERTILQSTPKDFEQVAADNGHKVIAMPAFRSVNGYAVTAYACRSCAQMWCSPSAFFRKTQTRMYS